MGTPRHCPSQRYYALQMNSRSWPDCPRDCAPGCQTASACASSRATQPASVWHWASRVGSAWQSPTECHSSLACQSRCEMSSGFVSAKSCACASVCQTQSGSLLELEYPFPSTTPTATRCATGSATAFLSGLCRHRLRRHRPLPRECAPGICRGTRQRARSHQSCRPRMCRTACPRSGCEAQSPGVERGRARDCDGTSLAPWSARAHLR